MSLFDWNPANSGSMSDSDDDDGWMSNLTEAGGAALEGVGDLSGEIQEEIERRVKEATAAIEAAAADKINAVKSALHESKKKCKGLTRALEQAKESFEEQVAAAATAAEEALSAAKEAAEEAANSLKEELEGRLEAAAEKFSAMKEALQNKLNVAKEWAAGIKEKLKGKLTALYDAIQDKVGGAWDSVKDAVSSAAEAMHDLFKEGLGGFVGRLMDFIGRVIVVRVKSAANIPAAIAGGIEGVINDLWHTITDEVVTVAVNGEQPEAPPVEEKEESGAWGAFGKLTDAVGISDVPDGPATLNDEEAKNLGNSAFGENTNAKETIVEFVGGISEKIPFMDFFSDIMGDDDEESDPLPDELAEEEEEAEEEE